MKGNTTREQIKLAARRLFAQRGIDGVTVREIVAASTQKNAGSLHYYFRTKEALVRELIVDTAALIDSRRIEALDALEKKGGPGSLREVLEVLILPSTNLGGADGEEDTYLRFISMLALQDRQLLDDVLQGGLNTGYQRCLGHIRKLVYDVDPEILEQRIVFMSISLRAILAAREASLEAQPESHHFWVRQEAISNLLNSMEGLLTCAEKGTGSRG